MARPSKAIYHGQKSKAYYYLYRRPDANDLRQLKIRLVLDNRFADAPVKFNGKNIKVVEHHFEDGQIIGGYQNEVLTELKYYLPQVAKNALRIGDLSLANGQRLTDSTFNEQLYSNITTDQEVINMLEAKRDVYDFIPGILTEQELIKAATEDVEKQKLLVNPGGLSVEDRYKKGYWNNKNIFELLGYVRHGVRVNANGKEVPLIYKGYNRVFPLLLTYRINASPTEDVKFFNEAWVHSFYRFIIKYGYNPKLHKLSHNLFITDPKYRFKDVSQHKKYTLNYFTDCVDKHIKAYIKTLYELDLIPVDFTKKIDTSAFAESTGGQLTAYNNIIYNLTIQEFLKLIHAELKSKVLRETRDLFVCSIMMGGLRVSDLKADKIIMQLDNFKMIQFHQKKTGGMVQNVMLKPVQIILEQYKGNLPRFGDQEFNENLKKLFKELKLNREIQKTVTTPTETRVEKIKLCDMISSKFARSTYYLLGAAMGERIEVLVKRVGHDNTDIAMKHYYTLGANYTEQDVTKLLEIFKK